MLNRTEFFNRVRVSLFGGRLRQKQVDGMNSILDHWRRSGLQDKRWLAYFLATTYHETGPRNHRLHMQPRHEVGRKSYFNKYEPGTRIGKSLGNTISGDGFKFRGRGFVQITGRANYARLGDRLGVPLVGDPERALEPVVACRIMFEGMVHGLFTGRKLGHYINGEGCDYYNARRIVNGTDRARLIAGYAEAFEEALLTADIPGPPDVPMDRNIEVQRPKRSLLETIFSFIGKLWGRK